MIVVVLAKLITGYNLCGYLKIQKSYFPRREILRAILRGRGKRVDLDNDEIYENISI